MHRRAFLTGLCGAVVLPAVASAQAATRRVYGRIVGFDGTRLTIRTATGGEIAVTVPADLPIGAVAERKLSDIAAGDYVGSAAMKGTDGRLHAQEVHIFRPEQRGVGEGHRPMDLPEQTMTNATVAEVAAPASGGVLRLKYPGGEQTILVGPEARVVALVAGDRGLLKPGATVRVIAQSGADGMPVARSIQAEKDGVPPLE